MATMTHSTFKSSLASIGLHGLILVLGSLALYKEPMRSLELTGAGGRTISLSNVSFVKTKSAKTSSVVATAPVLKKTVQTVSTKASAVTSPVNHGESASSPSTAGTVANSIGSSTGTGSGTGNGAGSGNDFDQGQLFSQIKNFFEARLGSTLNINVEQLIKIKVTLNESGEVLSADLVQGKLDFSMTKRILITAKNIPLKNFWKSTAPYPKELVIPLVLTPS